MHMGRRIHAYEEEDTCRHTEDRVETRERDTQAHRVKRKRRRKHAYGEEDT